MQNKIHKIPASLISLERKNELYLNHQFLPHPSPLLAYRVNCFYAIVYILLSHIFIIDSIRWNRFNTSYALLVFSCSHSSLDSRQTIFLLLFLIIAIAAGTIDY